ncbi:hypothetical protein HF295_07280 [Hujiaoplasma nucleasis]|uniref:InlB B-repeat-containing protein n=1 Tax=Hujiaoplasma nucleasis TaxID=2725268 RepID=A0A7L6N5W7_9MOLU|nr:InlB B-repeat-containing protein [Hujiaoplasma nucleasis]QLY40657.1 hypothetical protein HF295_07280 [Hujiaoplasma nucleasis]
MKRSIKVFSIIVFSFFIIGCSNESVTSTDISATSELTNIEEQTSQKETTTEVNTYTITWEVNGVEVEVDLNVNQGAMPVYDGLTPTKSSTNEFYYTFTGWAPTINAVVANQTYVAQFSESTREYSVAFNSNGGSLVEGFDVGYGSLLEEPQNPTKEGYRFIGWYSNESLTTKVEWPLEVLGDVTLFAAWNESVPYGDYLSGLLSSYGANPTQFIPDSLLKDLNLVSYTETTVDYSSFVDTTSVLYGGFGEQWGMVSTNLEQSQMFFNVLTTVDLLASTSVLAFNNYLDSNPEDTANYSFNESIYNVTISYREGIIYYILDFTTNLPMLGEQTIQIALSHDIINGIKEGRIQIGDANALKYISTKDSYQFAIKYAGIRRAYFEIFRDEEDNIEGRIFEYLEIEGVYSLGSSVQFFIDEEYLSVVGNKSSSMIGWSGTIVELYDVNTGRLLGYEIQESLSMITFNTLWFNLNDTSGINTIKFEEAPLENNNPYLVYVNGDNEVFESKMVGGLSLKTSSRRYDIELRTQYFFYLDGEDIIKTAVLVPMIFVQQENLSTLVSDINSMNVGLNFDLNISSIIYNRIINDYTTLIDPFILQKEEITSEIIVSFIGEVYIHDIQ